MKIEKVVALIVVVGIVAVLGCSSDEPRLTQHQVDQILTVQQSVVEERVALGKARDELEADRRQWAERERSDPIIASAIDSAALLVACCLPILIVLMLFLHRPQQPEFDVAEAVLLELSRKDSSATLLEAKERAVPILEDRRES